MTIVFLEKKACNSGLKNQETKETESMSFGMTLTFPTVAMRNLVARIVEATTGARPELVRDGESGKKLMYGPTTFARTVLMTPSEECQRRLGNPMIVLTMGVDGDRREVARLAADMARIEGHAAEVFDDLEPDFPKGFAYFVNLGDEFGGRMAMAFGPNKPTPDEMKAMPVIRPFVDEDMAHPTSDEPAD